MADEKTEETTGFTAVETKVILSMLKNLKGDIAADFDAVAAECGYKDAGVAKKRWYQIKIKRNIGGSGADNASPAKKGTGAKRVKAVEDDDNDDDDDVDEPKVKKGAKRARGKKAAGEAQQDVKAEDGEEAVATVEEAVVGLEDGEIQEAGQPAVRRGRSGAANTPTPA